MASTPLFGRSSHHSPGSFTTAQWRACHHPGAPPAAVQRRECIAQDPGVARRAVQGAACGVRAAGQALTPLTRLALETDTSQADRKEDVTGKMSLELLLSATLGLHPHLRDLQVRADMHGSTLLVVHLPALTKVGHHVYLPPTRRIDPGMIRRLTALRTLILPGDLLGGGLAATRATTRVRTSAITNEGDGSGDEVSDACPRSRRWLLAVRKLPLLEALKLHSKRADHGGLAAAGAAARQAEAGPAGVGRDASRC
jgi:hypothetical protein